LGKGQGELAWVFRLEKLLNVYEVTPLPL